MLGARQSSAGYIVTIVMGVSRWKPGSGGEQDRRDENRRVDEPARPQDEVDGPRRGAGTHANRAPARGDAHVGAVQQPRLHRDGQQVKAPRAVGAELGPARRGGGRAGDGPALGERRREEADRRQARPVAALELEPALDGEHRAGRRRRRGEGREGAVRPAEVAKRPRRDADEPRELRGERADAPVPDLETDLADAQVGGEEQPLRRLDAERAEEASRRQAGDLPEDPVEVVWAKEDEGGELLEREALVEPLGDLADDVLDRAQVRRGRLDRSTLQVRLTDVRDHHDALRAVAAARPRLPRSPSSNRPLSPRAGPATPERAALRTYRAARPDDRCARSG